MRLRTIVSKLFNESRIRCKDLYEEWVRISWRIGALLPNSLLAEQMQKTGELDFLIRCLEDEFPRDNPDSDGLTDAHYQNLLSEQWISNTYEIFRLLKQRQLVDQSEVFKDLFYKLELLRIPLQKHELTKDNKIDDNLVLIKTPSGDNLLDQYIYGRADDKRAHIMPKGLSARGSIMWQATDPIQNVSIWIERRDLSDRIFELWKEK